MNMKIAEGTTMYVYCMNRQYALERQNEVIEQKENILKQDDCLKRMASKLSRSHTKRMKLMKWMYLNPSKKS